MRAPENMADRDGVRGSWEILTEDSPATMFDEVMATIVQRTNSHRHQLPESHHCILFPWSAHHFFGFSMVTSLSTIASRDGARSTPSPPSRLATVDETVATLV